MDEIKTKTLSWQNKTGRFNPEAYSWSFFCCLIMRIFLAGMGFMVWNSGLTQHLPDDPSIFHVAGEPVRNGLDQVLTGVWLRWDANQYTSIARSGYSLEKLTAFFPGYPLLGRLIAFVTHGDLLSILLAISFISTVGAGVTLYQIVERHYSVSTARMCVIGLLLFPSSFYYFAPYPMSLGLWVGLSAFQAGEKNRWAGVFLGGLFAGLLHPTLFPLALALLGLAWQQRKDRKPWQSGVVVLSSLGPVLGIILFFAWRSYMGFGNYVSMQQAGWNRGLHYPWDLLLDLPHLLSTQFWLINMMSILLAGISIAACVWEFKHGLKPLFWYQLAVIGLLLVTSNEISLVWSRNMLSVFPFFIFIGRSLRKMRWGAWVLGISLGLQLFNAVRFFMGFL